MAWLIVGEIVVWMLWLAWALCHVAREADEQTECMCENLRANDYRLHRDLHKGDRD